MLDVDAISTGYAKSGELNIAYQVFGTGDVNLVLIPGWASHLENYWTVRGFVGFAEKLAHFARVVMLDRRGTGLSDPVSNPPTLEERMDDVRAVMDAVGWQRATIWGISEGGPMAMMFAATYPDRTQALLLYGTFARFTRSDDYPHGYPPEVNARWVSTVETTWGTGELSRAFAPSVAGNAGMVRDLARLPLAHAVQALGVQLRVGVHTGECEVLGEKVSGMAVHVGARVASVCRPGQVLVTATVKSLVVGSGIQFESLGPHVLKGVPDEWHLFAAAPS